MSKVLNIFLAQFGVNINDNLFTVDELTYIENLIQHKNEIKTNKFDKFGNYDEQFYENTQYPYLDRFILERIRNKPFLEWPNKKPFAVCLTHDVDRVVAYSPNSFLRNLRKRLMFSDSSIDKIKLRLNILKTSMKVPFYTKFKDEITGFEKWLEIEKEFGVKSTYFFFVRPEEKALEFYDCDYLLDDKFLFDNKLISVKEYIKILHKEGHEIGVHGSFRSMMDKNLFKRQKSIIEEVINEEVVSSRQHYLRYNHSITPEIHAKSNIKIDSTLGLNMSVGFRNGTSYPYPIESKGIYIWELPLMFMDSSVYRNPNNDFDYAKDMALNIIKNVENTGGCLTINFHPDYVNIPKYFNLYRFILDETTKRNAYFGTAKEIIKIVSQCVESQEFGT